MPSYTACDYTSNMGGYGMSRIVFTLVLLVTIAALACNGCISTPRPTTPPPSSPELTSPSAQSESDIVVIECPTEARIGEYVAVKIELPSDTPIPETLEQEDYLLRIRDEFPPGEHDPGVSIVYDLGYAIPDENLVLSWYVQIPTETAWYDSFRPGNYKLEVTQEGGSTKPAPVHPSSPPGYQEGTRLHAGNLIERNIIIKD
jgi:hypothetical protein